jgi:hypothetical protein
MELLIYDKNRALAGIIEAYDYLRWTRRYSQSGSFELRAIATAANLNLLQIGNILWKSDDSECGIIDRVELTADTQEFVTVGGYFATGLLTRRIVWGTETLGDDISVAVQQLLDNHLIAPTDTSRQISGFSYSAAPLGIAVSTQISYKNLLLAVTELCDGCGVGLRTAFDPATANLTLALYVGTATQAVFAREFDNLNAQVFTASDTDSASVALVGGEGEGAARTLVTVGGGVGVDRRETFVDAKDLQSADFPDNYAVALAFRGTQKLAELAPIRSFDATANQYGNLAYKQDFDVGSVVTVVSKAWGVSVLTRITEVSETYDRDGMTLDIVFGRALPTLGEKLKGLVS